MEQATELSRNDLEYAWHSRRTSDMPDWMPIAGGVIAGVAGLVLSYRYLKAALHPEYAASLSSRWRWGSLVGYGVAVGVGGGFASAEALLFAKNLEEYKSRHQRVLPRAAAVGTGLSVAAATIWYAATKLPRLSSNTLSSWQLTFVGFYLGAVLGVGSGFPAEAYVEALQDGNDGLLVGSAVSIGAAGMVWTMWKLLPTVNPAFEPVTEWSRKLLYGTIPLAAVPQVWCGAGAVVGGYNAYIHWVNSQRKKALDPIPSDGATPALVAQCAKQMSQAELKEFIGRIDDTEALLAVLPFINKETFDHLALQGQKKAVVTLGWNALCLKGSAADQVLRSSQCQRLAQEYPEALEAVQAACQNRQNISGALGFLMWIAKKGTDDMETMFPKLEGVQLRKETLARLSLQQLILINHLVTEEERQHLRPAWKLILQTVENLLKQDVSALRIALLSKKYCAFVRQNPDCIECFEAACRKHPGENFDTEMKWLRAAAWGQQNPSQWYDQSTDLIIQIRVKGDDSQEGKQIPVHQDALKAASEFFACASNSDFKDSIPASTGKTEENEQIPEYEIVAESAENVEPLARFIQMLEDNAYPSLFELCDNIHFIGQYQCHKLMALFHFKMIEQRQFLEEDKQVEAFYHVMSIPPSDALIPYWSKMTVDAGNWKIALAYGSAYSDKLADLRERAIAYVERNGQRDHQLFHMACQIVDYTNDKKAQDQFLAVLKPEWIDELWTSLEDMPEFVVAANPS